MDNKPLYPKRFAAALIQVSYQKFGIPFSLEMLTDSVFEREAGNIPSGDNEGLFRFLDEGIYLINILYLQSWFGIGANSNNPAFTAVICAIKNTAAAIRFLEAQFLDGPARQNLRAFREQCLVLARMSVDEEFLNEFVDTKSPKSANEFWHKHLRKGKTEKFLRNFSKNGMVCPLVAENYREHLDKVLGASIHPSFVGFERDFYRELSLSDNEDKRRMIPRSQGAETEFVLFYASHLLLGTIAYCSAEIGRRGCTLELFKTNPLFKHFENETEAMENIGKSAGLMWLMLPKLTNRAHPDFDASVDW